MERDLTTAQLAAQLGLRPTTVQLYAREHRIPFHETPGGHRRFNLAEVQTALTMRKRSRARPAEQRPVTARFGRSPRARGAELLRAVRTSDVDVAVAAGGRAQEVSPDTGCSAAVALLADAVGVHLSVKQ